MSTEEPPSSTEEPASSTEEPPANTEEPTDPAESPTEQPSVDPASLFQVEIKQPDGWFNTPERNIRILIVPKTEQLWSRVSYRMDNDEWQEVKDNFSFKDNAYYADVPVTYNGTVTVRVYAADDSCFDTKQAIRMFDHHHLSAHRQQLSDRGHAGKIVGAGRRGDRSQFVHGGSASGRSS